MPSDPGMAPGTVRQVPDPRLNGMRLDFQRFYRRPGHGGRHPRNAVYNRNVDSENPLRADDRNPRGRHRADPHRGRIYRHHRERSHDPHCQSLQSRLICNIPADPAAGGGRAAMLPSDTGGLYSFAKLNTSIF